MTLTDFLDNAGELTYLKRSSRFGPCVRFRVYSDVFLDSFLDLDFRLADLSMRRVGPYGYCDITMRYSEFEKLLNSLIKK